MGKTVLARYHKGVLEPLEPVELEEGQEVTITIVDIGNYADRDAFASAAGSWARNVDVDAFLRDRARTRRIRRPRVAL